MMRYFIMTKICGTRYEIELSCKIHKFLVIFFECGCERFSFPPYNSVPTITIYLP